MTDKLRVVQCATGTFESRIAIHDEDDTDQGCLGTAMHAVHAVVPVCAPPPAFELFSIYPRLSAAGRYRRTQAVS